MDWLLWRFIILTNRRGTFICHYYVLLVLRGWFLLKGSFFRCRRYANKGLLRFSMNPERGLIRSGLLSAPLIHDSGQISHCVVAYEHLIRTRWPLEKEFRLLQYLRRLGLRLIDTCDLHCLECVLYGVVYLFGAEFKTAPLGWHTPICFILACFVNANVRILLLVLLFTLFLSLTWAGLGRKL